MCFQPLLSKVATDGDHVGVDGLLLWHLLWDCIHRYHTQVAQLPIKLSAALIHSYFLHTVCRCMSAFMDGIFTYFENRLWTSKVADATHLCWSLEQSDFMTEEGSLSLG